MKEIFYDWGGANVWLFKAVNAWRGETLETLMRLGSALGDHEDFPIYLALLAIVGAVVIARAGDDVRAAALRWLGVLVVFSSAYVLEGFVVSALKQAFDFPRPAAALGADMVQVVGAPGLRNSLPSGHAVFAITLVASTWTLLGRGVRLGAAAFVVWVGVSRMNLGAHFPADVLAGYAVGAAVVAAVAGTWRFALRRYVDTERAPR